MSTNDWPDDLPPKPESWGALVAGLTPDIVESLKTAVELGKWPNGDRLTAGQRDHCLAAVIAWEADHRPEAERVGYIDRTRQEKKHCND
jgi:uncharacterized protein YeaC (DUF1315 family)